MSSCKTTDIFNVVILYDHFTSVGRAMAAYSHLTRELEGEFTPELRIWRIDVAMSPECVAQADDDIEAAEMVILAVRGSQPCPAAFLRWAESAADGGRMPRQAMIAIVDAAGEPAQSAGTWTSVLRSTASQIQTDLILWTPPAPFSQAQTAGEGHALEAPHGIDQPSRANGVNG